MVPASVTATIDAMMDSRRSSWNSLASGRSCTCACTNMGKNKKGGDFTVSVLAQQHRRAIARSSADACHILPQSPQATYFRKRLLLLRSGSRLLPSSLPQPRLDEIFRVAGGFCACTASEGARGQEQTLVISYPSFSRVKYVRKHVKGRACFLATGLKVTAADTRQHTPWADCQSTATPLRVRFRNRTRTFIGKLSF